MPDPIEMLIKDHREVEALFERYRSTPTPALIEEICTELTVHTAVEEKVVYPVLGSSVDGGRQMRSHAEDEHGEVKEQMLKLETLGYDSPEADLCMQKIIQGVTEHVSEEEGEVLPAMRSQLTEERMMSIGEEAMAAKEAFMAEAQQAGPLIDLTKDELYKLAQEKGIEHRSDMNKKELISALRAR
ncbi:MAG TPA: hemerythrin domain-containing protein [Acidimicrobiales bacterium]|nr:hemerythrin domain-containing protein [Acidimicrobiales bacterium]